MPLQGDLNERLRHFAKSGMGDVTRASAEALAKIKSDAKVIAALREALEELRVLGEQGAPPDYTRWLAFHDRVAEIARNGLGAVEQTAAKDDEHELRSSRLRRWQGL